MRKRWVFLAAVLLFCLSACHAEQTEESHVPMFGDLSDVRLDGEAQLFCSGTPIDLDEVQDGKTIRSVAAVRSFCLLRGCLLG